MSKLQKVGLIGVGLMGHGIGKNVLAKGFPLSVLAHRNRKPVEDLIALGAVEAARPRDMAGQCDLVILCVTGSPQVEAVVRGADGLIAGMRPGLVIADCSTALPQSTRQLAREVAAAGGHFLDTPMTRTPKEAEAGKLALMTGGDRAVLDRIRPVLDCFADQVVHVGETGSAHTVKLVNNFIALGTAAVVSEALAAARTAGVDMAALNQVVSAGGANSVMFGRIIKVVLENDDSALQFVIQNAVKDLRYYNGLADSLGATSILGSSAEQIFQLAVNLGFKERYVGRLVDALAELNAGSGVGPVG
jgi:3-hydroxyisobutyrate dehydrogenase-like beta-hydroxyacid dehydrogenase